MSPRLLANRHRPEQWQQDTFASIAQYNLWFREFAPATFQAERESTTQKVEQVFKHTRDFLNLTPAALESYPEAIAYLRMATAPPIARDRLIGLAQVSKKLVQSMENKGKLPPKMSKTDATAELARIGQLILSMADTDVLPWVTELRPPTPAERERAATLIADRRCGATSDPIVRNAQEARQLAALAEWLEARGYRNITKTRDKHTTILNMPAGTFALRMQVRGQHANGKGVNIPVDAIIRRLTATEGELPILVEAKSAGDFTNTNKRRKEEATKYTQLVNAYGPGVEFVLLLCGYFDSTYLDYEADAGIDWVWEHRLDDFALLNL